MYAATEGPNVKWGEQISNVGAGHHWPPAGDGPARRYNSQQFVEFLSHQLLFLIDIQLILSALSGFSLFIAFLVPGGLSHKNE